MNKSFTILCILLFGVISYTSCKKEYSCENCNQHNQPPIADAGPDQIIILPTDSITLDGSSSSDADGTISNYSWRKIAGPASFSIPSPSLVKTVVKDLTAGLYQVELTVTDNDGLNATDTMRVIVNDPAQTNRPPVAIAGDDGDLIYHIRYGNEVHLPREVRSLVKSEYFDQDIIRVWKINQEKKNIWVICMEDSREYIYARVENMELEETKRIQKAY